MNNESVGHRWRNRKSCLLVLCILVVVGGLITFRSLDPQLPPGVSQLDFDNAAAEFQAEFDRDGDHLDVLMTLGEIAAEKRDYATAIACYQQIPTEHLRYGPSARYEEAQLFAQTDQVRLAEESFNEFLKLLERGIRLPDRQVAHSRRWLSLILGVQLRQEERRIVLHGLMEDHQADINDVKQYYFESLLIWQTVFGSERVREFLEKDPDNRNLRVAAARYGIGEGRLKEAREQLAALRREDPNDLRALAVLLESCYEMNDWSAFANEFATAPEFRKDEPWLLTQLRGEWALHQNDWLEAEKYFQYMLESDPANAVCLMGLARAFADQGKSKEREAILQRSLLVAKLRVDLAAITHDNPKGARSVAHSARQLGMEDAAATLEFFAARMPDETR
ncbi:MAG: tetratricopeptide repeat protein [Planctomycetota bacterium]|nr:tetratricopeptide repeat protein [Planctomycetota bacterium]